MKELRPKGLARNIRLNQLCFWMTQTKSLKKRKNLEVVRKIKKVKIAMQKKPEKLKATRKARAEQQLVQPLLNLEQELKWMETLPAGAVTSLANKTWRRNLPTKGENLKDGD